MRSLAGIIDKWAHQSVVVVASTGYDSWGNPTTSAASTYQAIVLHTNKVIRGADGNEKVSTCRIFFPSSATIHADDRITLPDGTQPRILSINSYPDFEGNNVLTEVYT